MEKEGIKGLRGFFYLKNKMMGAFLKSFLTKAGLLEISILLKYQ
jgi:hypothetical protein